jgi:hypothetical protein
MKPLKIMLAATLATLLVGCAGTQSTTETLLGRADAVMRSSQAAGSVRVVVSPLEVRFGQPLAIEITSGAPGYLYLYQLSTDGRQMNLLFPNAADGANYLQGQMKLPRPTWRATARGPAGVGYLVAVVSAQPQDLTALAAGAREGRFNLAGSYAAAMTSFKETN